MKNFQKLSPLYDKMAQTLGLTHDLGAYEARSILFRRVREIENEGRK